MEFRSKLVEGVGAFIHAKITGRYLFLLRNNTGSWPLTWALPGGKINHNETLITGLAREIQEELGGTIKNPELILLDNYASANGKFRYTTYYIEVDYEFVPELNDEHVGYAWLPLTALPRPLHPGVSRTLESEVVINKIYHTTTAGQVINVRV